jgi:hypothetical protein
MNQPPVIENEISQINQGSSISLNLLANDSDPEGDNLTLVNVDNANVTFTTDGQVIYTPAADFFGVVVIDYTVEDSAGNAINGQWQITVIEVVDAKAKTTGGGTLPLSALILLLVMCARRQYKSYEK